MSWIFTDDDSDKTKYRMQNGWFWDPIRNYQEWDDNNNSCYELTPIQIPDLYLFSPDGRSSEAKGTPGMTVASNLTELLNCFGKTYIEGGIRYDNRGDTLEVDLNLKQTIINGWPRHPYHGKEAPEQRLSEEIEGLYFESSNYDDSITININAPETRLRSFFLRGLKGDDTLRFNGDFSAVSQDWMKRDGSDTNAALNRSINFNNAFTGDEGFDKLFIDSDSSLFRLEYLEDVNYFDIPEEEIIDLNSMFTLLGPNSSNLHGVDIEEIGFNDITFKRENILLAGSKTKVLLGGNAANYLHGNSSNNKIKAKSGDDVLSGGDGKDKLLAGQGNDTLIHDADNFSEKFSGGGGNDTVSAAFSNAVVINLNKGSIYSEIDSIKTADQLKSIENAIGSIYSDTIIGNDKNNTIHSHGGSDIITSGGGNDSIHLKVDNNNQIFRPEINGGSGIDKLYIDKASSDFIIISDNDPLLTTQLLSRKNPASLDIYTNNVEEIHFSDSIFRPKVLAT